MDAAAPRPPEAPRAGGGRRAVVALTGVCLVQFLLTVNGSIVNSALPAIQKDFGVDLTALQWVVSAFIVTIAGLLTAAGSLADRLGRRRTLLIGLAVLAAGSLVCALSTDVLVLIGGRIVQAVGAAALATAGLAAASTVFRDPSRRSAAVAWWAGVGTVALVAGPALGGALVGLGGWRAVFWASIVLAALAAVLVVGALAESRAAKPGRFDVLGQILVSTLLVALSVVLIEAPRRGWSDPVVLVAAAVAVAALAVVLVHVRRVPHPLIPPSLFRSVPYVAASISALLGYAAAGAAFFTLPLLLQTSLGLDVGTAAVLMLPIAGAALVAAQVSAWVVDRGRSRIDLVAAGVLLAAGAAVIAFDGDALVWIIAGSIVFGAGYGLIGDPLSVSALAALPPEDAGLASALFSTGKQFGQLVGIAVVGIVLGSATSDLAQHFARSGPVLWAVIAGAGLIVALVNTIVGKRASSPQA